MAGVFFLLRYNTSMIAVDYQRLGEIDLFSGLERSTLEAVIAAAVERRCEAGGYFFMQGDPAESIFLLVRGRIKLLQTSADGQQVLMRATAAYTLFGAVALAHIPAYPVSAQAAEDSTALVWPKRRMMEFVQDEPRMAMNAISLMAAHVQEFQDRFRQMATERVERRLARTLLRLAGQSGRKIPEGVLIDLPLTRQDLAEMTGTTLYTVSRTLKHWEEQGLVISARERVVIVFPHGLVRIAEDLTP